MGNTMMHACCNKDSAHKEVIDDYTIQSRHKASKEKKSNKPVGMGPNEEEPTYEPEDEDKVIVSQSHTPIGV